jgi:hypothetical protein
VLGMRRTSSDARLRRLVARRHEGRLLDCLAIIRVYRHTTKKEPPCIMYESQSQKMCSDHRVRHFFVDYRLKDTYKHSFSLPTSAFALNLNSTQKPQNPKTPKPKNPKTQRPKNPKTVSLNFRSSTRKP